MEIRNKKELEETGEQYIKTLVEKIIKELPDISPKDCAILKTKGGYADIVIPQEELHIALKQEILSQIQKRIEESKTFCTELKEEGTTGKPIIRIFYKKNENIIADH